jgi:hypothetical protein
LLHYSSAAMQQRRRPLCIRTTTQDGMGCQILGSRVQ